jgi:hypothetical protein
MLTVTQLVKQFPKSCGTRRFITVFTTALPLVPILSRINPRHIVKYIFSPLSLYYKNEITLAVARQRVVASYYYITKLFVCVCVPTIHSFSMWSASYQRKVGDLFPELHV